MTLSLDETRGLARAEIARQGCPYICARVASRQTRARGANLVHIPELRIAAANDEVRLMFFHVHAGTHEGNQKKEEKNRE